ncbi:MAG: septum formation protein Maf [Planctomycetes bacterium]|nr:septum formation protein Maf [Planctomycetota bacterium]
MTRRQETLELVIGKPQTFRLVLASSSPRRRALLAEAGYVFDVVPSPFVEPQIVAGGLPPRGYAEALAYFKARSVAARHRQVCVLGADTIVAVGGANPAADGRILGKPSDSADARGMLETLSGSRHAVITGLALLGPGPRRTIVSDTTFVTMRKMTTQEIEQYIASGEWIGKAGAYAIQETGDRFITKVEGSWSNVVGLPMELLEKVLQAVEDRT